MNRLWAPWRKSYIRRENARPRGCVFCHILKHQDKDTDLLIKVSRHSFAVLNRFPYNNGHVLILPKRHVARLQDLSSAERLDWLSLFEQVEVALRKIMKPHGLNAGMNLGSVSGAGIPGHLHLHVVPRWSGDTNFMPVIGETKIISESLESVCESMRKAIGFKPRDRKKKSRTGRLKRVRAKGSPKRRMGNGA